MRHLFRINVWLKTNFIDNQCIINVTLISFYQTPVCEMLGVGVGGSYSIGEPEELRYYNYYELCYIVTLHYAPLHYIIVHYNIVVYYIILQFITLCCIMLHYITLQYIMSLFHIQSAILARLQLLASRRDRLI